MTYWKKRGGRGLLGSTSFRNGRYLVKYGEARCGEWTRFFRDICKIQRINGLSDFKIYPNKSVDSNGFRSSVFLVKTWDTHSPTESLRAPVNQGGTAQNISNQPFNLFWDHVFAKYKNKYYDPSYGLTKTTVFTSDDALLDDYSQVALTAVVYAKPNTGGEAIHDHLHSGLYLSRTGELSTAPKTTFNSEYKYLKISMQNGLRTSP